MEHTTNLPENTKGNHFPIVAIGASAGGLEAIQELLKYLPGQTGMSFIYVQHLSPHYESQLTTILSHVTRMPVAEATDGLPLQPDHLYVIPPNKELTIIDGHLKLDNRPEKPYVHMPINNFFYSLAENHKGPIIGIILSGAASDGIIGLKAIKIAGGLTFAQGDTAEFQSMPQGAIAEGAVDLVLSPKEIAEELKRISTQKEIFYSAIKELNEESINNRDQHLLGILHLLNRSVGVDFRFYKMNTIKRRIIRRMMLHKVDNIESYGQFLRQHPAEINHLYQDLLINVTTFFRDKESMDYLRKHLLPEIIKHKGENDPIRIWVPACSTGQEAYSLAMLMVEALGDRLTSTPVHIFATDISENVINKARLGIYSKDDIADIPPKMLLRFFTKTEGNYRIVKSIRDICVFATHNVTKDPPFSRIDLISCCNLLIYLDTVLQKKIMATFHYALNNNGYLILGKSETANIAATLFTPVDKKVKIYAKKKDSSAKAMFEMNFSSSESRQHMDAGDRRQVRKNVNPDQDLERSMDHLLLSKYTPASVLVNNDLDILHFRGSTGLFLEPAPGRASLNLIKMARMGLGFELRNIVHKAKSTGQPAKKEGLDIIYQDKSYKVTIEAVPIRAEGDEQFFLVVFNQVPVTAGDEAASGQADARVKQLERELNALREDMRAIVEAQEAANEELQSANEEIVSSNEELQSINEELETSKEELESSNEELITINQELQLRNEQLAELQEYAEAVFTTIRESLLVLDNNLRIKTANNAFLTTFGLREEEVEGRLLFDLDKQHWNIPELRTFLYDQVPQQSNSANLELTHRFSRIGEKVLLFNARRILRKSHNEEIILLAIEDITEHKFAQRMVSEREEWMRNMANNAPVMMWVSGPDKLNAFVNKAYLEFRGIELENAVGKLWTDHVHPDDLERCRKIYDSSFENKQSYTIEYRLLRHDGVYRWIQENAKPNFSPEGLFTGFIGSCVDIHDQHMSQMELEKRVEERTRALLAANAERERSHNELQQLAYVTSHDLQEPLHNLSGFVDKIKTDISGQLTEEAQKDLAGIQNTTRQMNRMLEDLQSYSRITQLHKHFIQTDLNTVVANVLCDLEQLIQEKKAVVRAEKLPVLQAIPVQMAQLFYQLLHNSLKFSQPNQQPAISISGHFLTQEEQKNHPQLHSDLSYCELIVKDNGIGFSPALVERIFELNQKLNLEKDKVGSGIGLSLCRKIVSNHNGIIFARGKENDGAEFHLLLPVQQAE